MNFRPVSLLNTFSKVPERWIMGKIEPFVDKNIIEVLGLVRGNAVRARAIGKDIMAGFKSIVGGEITEFTQLLAQSREQATERMVERAEELGGNAIVATRYTTSAVLGGAAEILVYGTAVVIDKQE